LPSPQSSPAPQGTPPKSPAWFNRPALWRITGTNLRLLTALNRFNQDKPYPDRINPFNFRLFTPGAQLATDERKGARFRLIGPYESDPSRWLQLLRRDHHGPGPRQRVSIDQAAAVAVILCTYASVIDLYAAHSEPNSNVADGLPCHRGTIGLLRRRPAVAGTTSHIGNEANRIDEVKSGQISAIDLDDVLNIYRDPTEARWKTGTPLRLLEVPSSATRSNCWDQHEKARDILMGRVVPRPKIRK
jgi:hypothetical protein